MINAEALRDIYVERGLFPHAGDEIFGWYPDIERVLDEAVASGRDIPVPLDQYLAHLNADVHKALIPSIKQEGGLSIEEANLISDQIDAALKAAPELPPIVEAERLPSEPGAPVEKGFSVAGEFVTTEDAARKIQQAVFEETVKKQLLGEEAPITPGPERIAHAAALVNGKVYVGVTHPDALEAAAKAEGRSVLELIDTEGNRVDNKTNLEGFVTSEGRFITRLEAYRIAKEREQMELGAGTVVDASTRQLSSDSLRADDVLTLEDYDRIAKAVSGKKPKKGSIISDAEEVAENVRRSLYLEPLMKDEKAAGMTQADFKVYSRGIERIMEMIREKAISLAARVAKRQIKAEWKEPYAKGLAEAEALFDARPEVQAEQAFRNGDFKMRTEDGVGKIDAAYLSQKGETADDLAAYFGFETGEELLTALDALKKARGRKTPEGYRKAVTEAEATKVASAAVGDTVDRLEMALDVAAHQDVSKVLYDDLRVMQRQNEGELAPPLSFEELSAKGAENFGKETASKARSLGQWIRAIATAGRKAEMAAAKGDLIKAFKARNQQFMAQIGLREAIKLQKKWVQTQRLVRKYTGKPPKSVNGEFADQIKKLVGSFGVPVKWTKGQTALEKIPRFSDFIEQQNFFEGMDLPTDRFLGDNATGMTVDAMTVEQFNAFSDMIKSLDHIGRQKEKVRVEGRELELKEAKTEIVSRIENHPAIDTSRRAGSIRRIARGIDAMLIKIDRLFDHIERWEPDGPLQQYVMRPLFEGEALRNEMLKEVARRLTSRLKHPERRVAHDFVNEVSGVKYRFTRGDVAMMALNAGNRRNRDLLVDTILPSKVEQDGGVLARADREAREGQIMDFIERTLTEEDWKFVESVWDVFAWIKPQSDAVYRRVNGIAPDFVEGIPTLGRDGGYFPIMRDQIDIGPTPSEKTSPFEGDYHKISTPNAYTKARTGSPDKIQVEVAYEQLPRWVQMMVHDVAMREPVQQAHRLMNSKEVRLALNSRYGPEYSELMPHWLRHVANGLNAADREVRMIIKMMRATRQNFVVATLGANLTVILSPQIGPFLKDLGAHPRDVSWIMSHWGENRDFAMNLSQELRSRLTVSEREAYEMSHNILAMEGKWSRFQQEAARYGMLLPFKIDISLATVSWLTEYAKAMNDGAIEANAIARADKMVRDYYGSASPVNRAKIQSSGEFAAQASLFYGYMSTIYNRTASIAERTASGYRHVKAGEYAGAKRDFAKAAADSFTMVLVPLIFTALFYTDYDEDDSYGTMLAKAIMNQGMGMFPIARDIWYYMTNQQVPRPSTVFGTGKDIYDAADAVAKRLSGETDSDIWLKRSVMAAGELLGLPLGQLGRSSQFIWNMQTGQENPETPVEWMRGFIRGYSAPGGKKSGKGGYQPPTFKAPSFKPPS